MLRTGHVEHLGKVGVQMCLPNGTSKRLISTQNLFGNLTSRCSMVCSGVDAEINPHRFVTRWTWVSTLIVGIPHAIPNTRWAHFGPTPVNDRRTASSHGSVPP